MYLSGFRVPCTEAEKCGVDSALDKAWHVLLYNMRLREDRYDFGGYLKKKKKKKRAIKS